MVLDPACFIASSTYLQEAPYGLVADLVLMYCFSRACSSPRDPIRFSHQIIRQMKHLEQHQTHILPHDENIMSTYDHTELREDNHVSYRRSRNQKRASAGT